jgi:poly-gamma-glutamate synthesis protein (capsule biosynthesis protein)
MYDTGDFIDDYAIDPQLRNDRSCLFQLSIKNKKPAELQLIPVLISNMQVNLAEESEAAVIIDNMRKLSAEFGTIINKDGTIKFNN